MRWIQSTLLAISLAGSSWQLAHAQPANDTRGLTDDQLTEMGLAFEDAINLGDVESAVGLFDAEALAMRMAELLYTSAADRADFVRGAVSTDGLTNMLQQQINLVQSTLGYASYLRVHTIEDMRGPLLRYDLGDEGFSYILLIVEDREPQGPKIVDLFIGSNGERLSVSAGALAQLMAAPSSSLLGRLFGLRDVDTDLVEAFQTFGAQMRSGHYDVAYETIRSLPDAVRNHRVLSGISAQVAGMVGGDVYEEELSRLAALHGDDPRTAFLLVDYYFLRGDYDTAMQGVETLERIFGFDAAIGLLKTNIAITLGDVDAALAYAVAAEEAEPWDENGHWALLNVYLATKRHDEVVATLQMLEEGFGYLFDAEIMATEAGYADFVRSRQFEAWAADR